METAENKYITVAYKMYMVEDGEKEFGEEAPVEHPFQFISGLGLTLDAFEKQVKDLAEGDTFDFTIPCFTIPCADAYGEYDEEHVIELPKSVFLIDGKFDDEHVVPDAVIPMMTAEGQRLNGTVVEVKEDIVVMDMNHPLAGCDLNFVGQVVTSRLATNEEIAEMTRMMSGDDVRRLRRRLRRLWRRLRWRTPRLRRRLLLRVTGNCHKNRRGFRGFHGLYIIRGI